MIKLSNVILVDKWKYELKVEHETPTTTITTAGRLWTPRHCLPSHLARRLAHVGGADPQLTELSVALWS